LAETARRRSLIISESFLVRADNVIESIERIPSPNLVLACGAVETPRLMLASGGLANESGEVGRNFMDTLEVVVGALHPEPQHGRRGVPSDAICWDFNAPDAIPGVIGGCRFYNGSGENELKGLAAFALRAFPGWGLAHAQSVGRLWGHSLHVGAIGEGLPNRDSRVDLDPTTRDRFGIPVARIASFLDAPDIAACASWRSNRTNCSPRAAQPMSSASAGWATMPITR
jgi:choline dehydrogenase-like flavoprotein